MYSIFLNLIKMCPIRELNPEPAAFFCSIVLIKRNTGHTLDIIPANTIHSEKHLIMKYVFFI